MEKNPVTNESSPAVSSETVAHLVDAVMANLERPVPERLAMYRLQFRAGMTFAEAVELVSYFHELGVTHIYASPYLHARRGSPHGYDVCRHDEFNPELGTAEDFDRFVSVLRQHGMGHILDFVPNHMSASTENPWWYDILENGTNSPYAHFFDIDWQPLKAELAYKVLLPILGEQFGEALEAGRLTLAHVEGSLVLKYHDHQFPVGPKTAIPVLEHRLDELQQSLGTDSEFLVEYQSILTALHHLPPHTATEPQQVWEGQREKHVIRRRLRELEQRCPAVAEFIERNVAEFNGRAGDPVSFDRLDDLVCAQSYRPCHWRAASDEVNYRRFFDINELAAICMEHEEVFLRTHRLILNLLAAGKLDGIRIDHVDGLYDPTQYLWRLQWAYLEQLGEQSYSAARSLGLPTRDSADRSLSLPTRDFVSAAAESTLPAWDTVRASFLSAICRRLELPQPAKLDWSSGYETPIHSGANAPPVDPAVRAVPPVPVDTIVRTDTTLHPDVTVTLEATVPLGAAVPLDDTVLADPPASADPAVTIRTAKVVGSRRLPLFVVVEKILGAEEPLPAEWPVAGTTGYDFLNQLNGLFIEPRGLAELIRTYSRFIGMTMNFWEEVHRCKLMILRVAMSSELQMLAHRINLISEQHRHTRDFTLNSLRHALREILSRFPVYRTYPGPAGVSERDRRFIQSAVANAKRHNPAMDAALFDFIRKVLLLEHPEGLPAASRKEREEFTGRFQQVTSPVMAKGVEDTAFYVYCPLLSASEVGSHPPHPSLSVEQFHHENLVRQHLFPDSLVTTSTHDTKRSEDVRARLNVLTEVPHLWRKALNRWARTNRRYRVDVDGESAPSRNDEYVFYQSLVGVWPLEEPSADEHQQIIQRMQQFMDKSIHEAKSQTSWINPNVHYDSGVRDFVARALEQRKDNRFLREFRKFVEMVLDWGLLTAVSQLALKLLSPGVPDIYQGQEVWDFSLVDPDNRRPVDFAACRKMLRELSDWTASVGGAEVCQQLRDRPRDPRLKLFVTWQLLQLRRRFADLIRHGIYAPLAVDGLRRDHICAFAWQPPRTDQAATGSSSANRPVEPAVVVVVPRLIAKFDLERSDRELNPYPLSTEAWGDTAVRLDGLTCDKLSNIFSGQLVMPDAAGQSEAGHPGSATIRAADLFRDFPVAVLTRE